MTPSTLVLPPRYTTDSIAMSGAAARAHWSVERLGSWQVPEHLIGTAPAIYGEPLFVSVVADPLGVEMIQPAPNWLPSVHEEYRKRRVELATLGDARRVIEPTFIKPVDDKCFPARVYASGGELPPSSVLADSEWVLLSEPVNWELEFRAFILDRQVVAMSPYLRGGQRVEQSDGSWPATAEEIDAARAFHSTVLNDARLAIPPACVIDVGLITGRGWAIVEANSAWGSGLYACDPASVLPVVRRACIAKGLATPDDAPWLRSSHLNPAQ